MVEDEAAANHSIPFILVSETWFKSYNRGSSVSIPGYSLHRADRDRRIGGGVALFAHENLPATSTQQFDNSVCQGLICYFETIKWCVAVFYRPPSATLQEFKELAEFARKSLVDIPDDSTIVFGGDFNFPEINWDSHSLKFNNRGNSGAANLIFELMSEFFLTQVVDEATRGNNILDIILTNRPTLASRITATDTHMSDHRLVDVALSVSPSLSDNEHHPPPVIGFRTLDFNRGNLDQLKKPISDFDWPGLQASTSPETFPEHFTRTLLQICKEHIPRRHPTSGRPRVLNGIRRRKRRVRAKIAALMSCPSSNQAALISAQKKLVAIEEEMAQAIVSRIESRERKVIGNLKLNPKVFFKYAKSLNRLDSSIKLLFDSNGSAVTDPGAMADLLQSRFSSSFSDPNSEGLVCTAPETVPQFPFPDLLQTDLHADIITVLGELKPSSGTGPDGIPAILLKHCCHELATPLSIIWKTSLEDRTVPDFYKRATILPLHKKGLTSDPGNYRPISLTSHVVKCFERILRKHFVEYVENNHLLSPNQHGFRSGKSCLTQLLDHLGDVIDGLIKGVATDTIYLDYQKAFDSIDHSLLLKKLHAYGFPPPIVDWVASFLSGRTQTVAVQGATSKPITLISGVPQGTVLAPILFILFANDLDLAVRHSKVGRFADDTRLSKKIHTHKDVLDLQEDLKSTISWSTSNNMKLHPNKFELLISEPSNEIQSLLRHLPVICNLRKYSLPGEDWLEESEFVKDLGVTVHSGLSGSKHISNLAAQGKRMASWALSVFRSRDKTTMLTLYKSLVRSHLEYACPLWDPHTLTDIRTLEGVQRSFIAKIKSAGTNYWDRLSNLGIMSLQRRRERYSIIHCWKILHGLTPGSIKFNPLSPRGIRAVYPPPPNRTTSTARSRTLYENSFAVKAPKLWNTLPARVTLAYPLTTFKTALQRHLDSIPDRPPIDGYSTSNSNSLLDWWRMGGPPQRMA